MEKYNLISLTLVAKQVELNTAYRELPTKLDSMASKPVYLAINDGHFYFSRKFPHFFFPHSNKRYVHNRTLLEHETSGQAPKKEYKSRLDLALPRFDG